MVFTHTYTHVEPHQCTQRNMCTHISTHVKGMLGKRCSWVITCTGWWFNYQPCKIRKTDKEKERREGGWDTERDRDMGCGVEREGGSVKLLLQSWLSLGVSYSQLAILPVFLQVSVKRYRTTHLRCFLSIPDTLYRGEDGFKQFPSFNKI